MKRKPLSDELTLFGDDETGLTAKRSPSELANKYAGLTWSYTKHGVLMQCPRRSYYQYYGGNVRQAKGEVDKEHLRRLKLLVNREERAGQLLHLAIATYLRKAQKEEAITGDGMIRWTLNLFRKDMEFSRHGLERAELSTDSKAPRFLMEFLSEQEPEVLWAEAAADVTDALDQFLESPTFIGVRELGMTAETAIEKKFTHLACIPFGVEGQVDLAHMSDQGHVTIVDWKSGDYMGEGDESLQLSVYALWAQEVYECTPDALTVQKAFLGSDDLVTYPLSERKLSSAKLAILQDAECFVRMHAYGVEGVMDAFTPCAQEAVCRRCPFVTVCREGKECLS